MAGGRPEGVRNCAAAADSLSTFALSSPSTRPLRSVLHSLYVWTWERVECVVLYRTPQKEDEICPGRRNRTPARARTIWTFIISFSPFYPIICTMNAQSQIGSEAFLPFFAVPIQQCDRRDRVSFGRRRWLYYLVQPRGLQNDISSLALLCPIEDRN